MGTIVFETENYEVEEVHEHCYLARRKEDIPRADNEPLAGEHGEFFETEEEAIESLPESN